MFEFSDTSKQVLALALRLPWQNMVKDSIFLWVMRTLLSGLCTFFESMELLQSVQQDRIKKDDLREDKGINREKDNQWRAESSELVTEIGEPGSRRAATKTQRSEDESVLCTVWMDRTLVRMLTTTYTGQEMDLIPRRKPRANDTYTKWIIYRY